MSNYRHAYIPGGTFFFTVKTERNAQGKNEIKARLGSLDPVLEQRLVNYRQRFGNDPRNRPHYSDPGIHAEIDALIRR